MAKEKLLLNAANAKYNKTKSYIHYQRFFKLIIAIYHSTQSSSSEDNENMKSFLITSPEDKSAVH
ncbi:hypothetical protein T4B_14454 [Trichinella pseudospiralis]|uniref:Uncharacterized protein n=1 Tax=Trichinella pseudospiralis TaxID=6337 RepID=A0A0V1KGA5_TRIPS|nr:hypothetical protein T4B_14454 [Trichinella pseudospiralis]KRZ46262.1 hypothetical protein T4C_6813 [Trichinella pseudospiralis]